MCIAPSSATFRTISSIAPRSSIAKGLYGDASGDYPDNPVRFGVFCRAALTVIRHIFRPSVIHCHDWQSALVPIYLRSASPPTPPSSVCPPSLRFTTSVTRVCFPPESLPGMGLDSSLFHPDYLEFFGQVNLLKGGILASDAVTTVSPTYAREIQSPELGFGLDGVLRARAGAVTGILNGVDYTQWDPATDPLIPARYSPEDLSGKRVCKAGLLAEFGLDTDPERPLLGMVSRLAGQKGFDILQEIAADLFAEDVSFVILGFGDPKYQAWLEDLQAAYPDRVGVRIAYDDRIAHMIEAGSDIFLMPSLYEPCGLNQIYSLRYGTVPVVRATGGLDDTIDSSTGFKFQEYSGAALLAAIRQALAVYHNRALWKRMMLAGMLRDFSWTASAAQYAALYRRLSA